MKAILEFDLNEQDDVTAHKQCAAIGDLMRALHAIDDVLRRWRKEWDTPDAALESISTITADIAHHLYD